MIYQSRSSTTTLQCYELERLLSLLPLTARHVRRQIYIYMRTYKQILIMMFTFIEFIHTCVRQILIMMFTWKKSNCYCANNNQKWEFLFHQHQLHFIAFFIWNYIIIMGENGNSKTIKKLFTSTCIHVPIHLVVQLVARAIVPCTLSA